MSSSDDDSDLSETDATPPTSALPPPGLSESPPSLLRMPSGPPRGPGGPPPGRPGGKGGKGGKGGECARFGQQKHALPTHRRPRSPAQCPPPALTVHMRIGRPAFRGGRTISAGGGGAPARAPQPQPVAQSWPPAQQQVSRTGSSDSGSGSGSDEEGGGPAGSSDGGRPVSGSSSGDSSATTASVVHEANERIYRLSEQLANAEKRAEAAEAAASRAAAVAGPLESRCAELESDLESKIGLLSTTQQQLRMAEEEARAERGALPSSSLLQTVENLRAENDALKAAAGVSGVAAATAVAVDAPVAIVQLAPGEKGPTRALEDEAEDMLFYSGQLEELREELKEAEEQCDVYRQQHSELQAALLVAHKQATPTKQAENLSESITAPWSTPRRQQQAQQQRAVLCEAGDENEDRLGDGAATMAMVEKLKEELNYFRQENSRLKIEMQ